MTLFGPNQLVLATVILTVILGLSLTGDGIKQEMWLYKEDGNGLYFHTHVPDLAEFDATLPRITKVCYIGQWFYSTTVNYQTFEGYTSGGVIERCYNKSFATIKSLRHFGASDTAKDALSLYSGKNWAGDEIFVDTRAKTDISIPIITLAATGTADWMLYEGKNFDGKSVCYQVPNPGTGTEFRSDSVVSLNMTTIGSVFKGCDLYEIQLYTESLVL